MNTTNQQVEFDFEAHYSAHLEQDEPLGPPRERIERHLRAAGFARVPCKRCDGKGALNRVNGQVRRILCPNCSGEGHTWQQQPPEDMQEVQNELHKAEEQQMAQDNDL